MIAEAKNIGVLIIGYGRAGKRHEKLCREWGLKPFLFDPLVFTFQDATMLTELLASGAIEYAVICTPPDSHLYYINKCLKFGLEVLCEKPLCDLGQLAEAKAIPEDSPVMVAYNYRYHPKLAPLRKTFETVAMLCKQYRPEIPSWGLLLDHVSHDLDIIRTVTKESVTIRNAFLTHLSAIWGQEQQWQVILNCGGIIERVSSDEEEPRVARLVGDNDVIEIDPDPKMFTDMWLAFLDGDYYPGLAEAIKTQELLETCYHLNEELK